RCLCQTSLCPAYRQAQPSAGALHLPESRLSKLPQYRSPSERLLRFPQHLLVYGRQNLYCMPFVCLHVWRSRFIFLISLHTEPLHCPASQRRKRSAPCAEVFLLRSCPRALFW